MGRIGIMGAAVLLVMGGLCGEVAKSEVTGTKGALNYTINEISGE